MGEQPGPARPPPRPPAKEAPPKVENSAFTALDPLGDKEKKSGKDMFKDFQIAKPPAIPARKGELASSVAPASSSSEAGAFDQYFSSKVGVAQDAADHDDFDINQMSAVVNGNEAFMINWDHHFKLIYVRRLRIVCIFWFCVVIYLSRCPKTCSCC